MKGWVSGSVDDFNPTTGSIHAFGGGTSTVNLLQEQLTGSVDMEGNSYRINNIKTIGP